MLLKLFVLIGFSVAIASSKLQKPITRTVETNYGGVRGLYQTSPLTEGSFYSFRGIPYAKPPIDERRFKAPEPIEPWHPNIINAFNYRNACMQPYTNEINTGISEDCLYLNIFVPEIANADEKLPVLFHIHGGAFFKNAADDVMNGPDFLVPRGIIFVTMNYRHNIFGYLTLNTPEISGNQAIKDQFLALKWIYENIEYFDGDPKRITVMGHSSGAVSANYLALNPISSPYVAGLLAMGGSLGGLAVLNHHEYLSDMYERTNTTTMDDLLAFLMTQPSEIVMNIAYPIEYHVPYGMYWGPVIERADAVQAFVTEPPSQTYKKHCLKAPSLFMFVETESFPVIPSWQLITDEAAIDDFIANFDVPLPIRYYDDVTEDEKKAFNGILSELKEFYFANAMTYEEKVHQLVHLWSDISFTYGFLKGYKVHRENACHENTYLFQTALDGAFNFMKEPSQFNLSQYPYMGHVDPLNYLFPLKTHLHVYENVLKTKDTDEFSRISWNAVELMTKICANFVKFEKPIADNGLEFPTMQANLAPYMKLTRTGQLQVESEPFRGVLAFYEDLMARGTKILDGIRANKLSQSRKTEL